MGRKYLHIKRKETKYVNVENTMCLTRGWIEL